MRKKSIGLGDTIAKVTEVTGIKKAVDVLSEMAGVPCNCERRKDYLNNLFPYSQVKPFFNPKEHPKPEEGIYEVLHQINATKKGTTFNFIPGDKVLMKEENLLYPDWAYYISIGACKKL